MSDLIIDAAIEAFDSAKYEDAGIDLPVATLKDIERTLGVERQGVDDFIGLIGQREAEGHSARVPFFLLCASQAKRSNMDKVPEEWLTQLEDSVRGKMLYGEYVPPTEKTKTNLRSAAQRAWRFGLSSVDFTPLRAAVLTYWCENHRNKTTRQSVYDKLTSVMNTLADPRALPQHGVMDSYESLDARLVALKVARWVKPEPVAAPAATTPAPAPAPAPVASTVEGLAVALGGKPAPVTPGPTVTQPPVDLPKVKTPRERLASVLESLTKLEPDFADNEDFSAAMSALARVLGKASGQTEEDKLLAA
jgi:hypothetical protein